MVNVTVNTDDNAVGLTSILDQGELFFLVRSILVEELQLLQTRRIKDHRYKEQRETDTKQIKMFFRPY